MQSPKREKEVKTKEKDAKAKEKELARAKEKEEAKAKEQERLKAKELEKAKAKEAEQAKAKEKERLKEERAKEKARKKEAKKASNADVFGTGDGAAPTEAVGEQVNGAAEPAASNEPKTPSPRKSIARAFRRKTLLEDTPEEKSPVKTSPTKKVSSPKKSLTKLPKPEKKTKLVTKKQEATSPDEADPNAPPIATETDPLTPTKSEEAESPTRRKSRWRVSVPDLKHHKGAKASNNQKEPIHEADEPPESVKTSPRSKGDNNASPRNSPRGRDKRSTPKRGVPIDASSSEESEGENQTNILSPLRRHKPDPEDTLPIPESPHKAYLMQKRMAQLDVPPAYQPEVHLVGEIVSGQGFGVGFGFCCKWRVEYGSRWSHIAGDQSGQTQVDFPPSAPWGSSDVAVWAHPIDLHFATTAFQGWPRLLFQVDRVDPSRKHHPVGYGFAPVPFAAGQHELTVSLWRPLGTMKQELDALILGRMPELQSDDVLFNAAWSERCQLRTVSTGKVVVHLGVLLRHFQPGTIDT